MTKAEQFVEAKKRLELLNVMPEVKDHFNKGEVFVSRYYNPVMSAILYNIKYSEKGSEISMAKKCIEEFEKTTNNLVYHAQLVDTKFGKLLSLFYVSEFPYEWQRDRDDLIEGYSVCYVVNDFDIDNPCSEYGSIMFKRSIGGIERLF